MTPWVLLDESVTPDGTVLGLWQRGKELSIRANQQTLMGSRCQASEVALARRAIEILGQRARPSVLVGGLGFGHTLRAALDHLPEDAAVTVSESASAVVAWNRGLLRKHAGAPLDDRRVTLLEGDVVALLKSETAAYDIVLLDVDNGPQALTQGGNSWLYGHRGLVKIAKALRPGGVLAVWSAGPDTSFTRQLQASGYAVTCERVRARENGKGDVHTIWMGKIPRRGAAV